MTAEPVGGPVDGRDQNAADFAAPGTATTPAHAESTPSTDNTPSADDTSSADSGILARLADEVGAFGRRIEELTRLGERREHLLDRLHAENQRLRAGEVAQVQAPLLRQIIRSYDLVVSLAANDAAARSALELVRNHLLEALEQAGVRPLDPEPESPFDAVRHTAVRRVETAIGELDMTVAYSLRAGFVQDGERVLRPADVAVHRHRPGLVQATESED
ncbi:MAG TPA: nucleotide exchange factor GrpE [Streptosporangiaceae bacterium]